MQNKYLYTKKNIDNRNFCDKKVGFAVNRSIVYGGSK